MKSVKNLIFVVITIFILLFGFLLLWFNYLSIEKTINLNILSPEDKMKNDISSIAANYSFNISEIESVEKIKNYGADAVPLLAEMAKNSRKETRYLAYIALSGLINRLPDQKMELINYLKNGLNDSDAAIRVQVAQLLLVQGVKEAIPALINALNINEMMIPSEPIIPINEYAQIILSAHLEQNFGINKDKWQIWWNANQKKLIWDEKTEKFK